MNKLLLLFVLILLPMVSNAGKSTNRQAWVQNRELEIMSNNTQICRFEKVTMNGDQRIVEKKEITLHFKVEGVPEYQKEVSGFNYVHEWQNAIERGNSEYQRTEGHFKIFGRTDIVSAVKDNGFDADKITTKYTFYHESCTYDDGEVNLKYDFEEGGFWEKSTVVKTIASPVAGKDAAKLTNTISTFYCGYRQEVSESVILLKDANVSITDEGFVATGCKETVYGNNVTAHVLYRITKSDGTHEDFEVDFSDTRTSEVDPAWSSIESNNTQSTSSASRTETGNSDQSASKNDFTAKWKRYSYNVKSVATLSGSKQNNRVKVVEPEGWEITYRGKTFKFNRPEYTVSNDNGTVTGGSEKNGYNEYNYANKFSYTRGSNNKSFTANGVIKVKSEEPIFFPKEWGALIEAKQTVANNETHNSFVYTWSLRFKNNIVLPVVIRSGEATPEWHLEYAENTTVTQYNGGTYEKGSDTWINTTASDKPNQMVWSRDSRERANKDYLIAKNQNWDEGHLIDGHSSTQTSRYQLTVSNGVLKATDTYTGKYIGEWKYSTDTAEIGEFLPGDVDGNGQVDFADVEATLNYILRHGTLANEAAADMNGDGIVDIADLVAIIGLIK